MLQRLCSLLVLALCAFAQTTLTPEQAMKTRDLTDPHWSPDGRRVAVVVREPFSARYAQRHIWIYDTPTSEFRQWTFSTKSETNPRWSPDGKWLAFLSDREDADQIWLISVSGGEPVKLTSAKNSVSSFDWSPDGARIAYLARDPSTEADDKKSKEFDDVRIIDEEEKRTRLWTIDLADKKPRQETKGAWAIRAFDWFPDSKRLLLEATDDLAPEKETGRIFILALADGRMDLILKPRGPFGNLKVSPDGASFAYTGARLDGPSAHDLYISPIASPAPRNASLFSSIARSPRAGEWIDSSEIAALSSRTASTPSSTSLAPSPAN